jgi:hypothetical protein
VRGALVLIVCLAVTAHAASAQGASAATQPGSKSGSTQVSPKTQGSTGSTGANVPKVAVGPGPAPKGNSRPKKGVSGHERREEQHWGLFAAFTLLALPGAIFYVRDRPRLVARGFRRLYVGEDNRVSTSKIPPLLWTSSIGFALLSIVFGYLFGAKDNLSILSDGLKDEYYVLLGGPFLAAAVAKGLIQSRTESGQTSKPPAPKVQATQAIQDDRGNTDLGDLQYMLFTGIALVFFYGQFFENPSGGLPKLPSVLVGLITVSAGGYVAKKAAEGNTPTITSVVPDRLPSVTAGTLALTRAQKVTITGTDFLTTDSANPANNAVLLNDIKLNSQDWKAGSVTVQLPVDAAALTTLTKVQASAGKNDQLPLVVQNDRGKSSAPHTVTVDLTPPGHNPLLR